MRLTIEMTSRTSFKIVEQDTGKTGWVSKLLYQDDFMAICQRASPLFSQTGDMDMPTLYLRGMRHDADEMVISCGSSIYKVLCTLKKAFSDFKILNCNKFILEGL